MSFTLDRADSSTVACLSTTVVISMAGAGPVASFQDAREGGFVASRKRARLFVGGVAPGAALLVVRVRS
ncbi:hypothetical protein, partial [Mycobacterium nebraskense]|uniref:hypothetical protein n=1 Tax=Mycobacterium nebraskense TaxID=244292 RepID=UPI0021F2DAC7